MKKVFRWFDWRFCLSFALLILITNLVYNGYSASLDAQAKSRRIDNLIVYINAQEKIASTERKQAREDWNNLLAYTRALSLRQEELLKWLRSHNINFPKRFDTVIPPPVSVADRSTRPPLKPRSNGRALLPPHVTPYNPPGNSPGKGKGQPSPPKGPNSH